MQFHKVAAKPANAGLRSRLQMPSELILSGTRKTAGVPKDALAYSG